MIGYCPLDQDPVELPSRRQDVIPQSRLQKPDKTKKRSVLGDDDTECNYVVMFFIAGVIALAVMDSLPSKK